VYEVDVMLLTLILCE